MEQFFRLCSKSTAVTEVIVAATVFFYLKVLKASTMLYRGGCNFGDEGDGPRSWCGHMLLAVLAMGEEGTS
ncbi:hypothetical protein QL285_060937 [Trifolium repens]|nr:hypothetical protein QL285_060937 [Trifolium repens]